jgi:hypothetical protein
MGAPTVTSEPVPPGDDLRRPAVGERRRAPAWLAAAAGPALIVVTVLGTMRGFAFAGNLTNGHPDLLTFWLPRFTFLGRSIAQGRIPLWNPYEMAGYPQAADPQGGWLALGPTALFSTLDPGAALRWLLIASPLLAGLGLYAFLRVEGLSRIAATAGGLGMAMLLASSTLALSVPFSGALAWTTIALLGAAGYIRAERWSRRLLWMGLGALGWGQVATAHMSHGLVICTLLVTAYLTSHAVTSVRRRELGAWAAAARVGLFVTFAVGAAAAIWVPRFDLLHVSSLHAGYAELGTGSGELPGVRDRALFANGVWAAWPLAFAAAPGAYAGAVLLLAAPLSLRAERRRAITVAFAGTLGLVWFLMLNAVVTAGWFRSLLLRVPFGDVYLHNPGRLRYLAVLAIPVLGAVGIQGLRDRPLTARAATGWLAAAAVVLLVVPLAAGAIWARWALLAVALLPAAGALWVLAVRRPRWAAGAVLAVLAVELSAGAALGSAWKGDTVRTGLEAGVHPNLPPQPLRFPRVSEAAYLREPPFVEPIREGAPGRYLAWVPPAALFEKGYLFAQGPRDWPALTMSRGSLFEVPDVLGYNPVQLARYWTYIRATNALPVFYNTSVLNRPSRQDVDLLGVRFLIVPGGVPAPVEGAVVASAEGYDLVEVAAAPPRASVVPGWRVLSDTDALRAVRSTGFDPARVAVLEAEPFPGRDLRPGTTAGTATYREVAPGDVRLRVEAPGPSILLVRNAYDADWTATVDGRAARVLPTDAFLQGVPVGPGTHEVRLVYRNPAIGIGLWVSAIAIGGWIVAIAVAILRERRSRRRAVAAPPR